MDWFNTALWSLTVFGSFARRWWFFKMQCSTQQWLSHVLPFWCLQKIPVISTVRDCFEGLSIADEMLNQCTAKNSPNILNKLRYSGYSSVHLKVNQVYETFSSPFQTKITEFSKIHVFCYSRQKVNRKSLCFLLL